jgi:hypothetical protein
MKVCETIQQSLQHVKTSLGTAVAKASETVKKVSRIALNTLKWLFSPITYLCTRAKSFFDKKHKQPSRGREASAPGESLAEAACRQALTNLIEQETDSFYRSQTGSFYRSQLELQLNQIIDLVRWKNRFSNMTEQELADYETIMRARASCPP